MTNSGRSVQLDCVTIGETMLRLDADPGDSLENADHVQIYVAGAESNVAVALARLGLRAAWISKLPDTPLGRHAERAIYAHGVDTSRVVWEKDGRMGLYFSHLAPVPRSQTVIYDRRGSSFARLTEAEVDWPFVRSARALHVTGITPALGDLPRQVIRRAVREARDAGLWVSFDLNYRAKLWSAHEARDVLTPLIGWSDLLICSKRDARMVFGADGDPEPMARMLHATLGCQMVCLTLGAEGAGAFDGERWQQLPAVPTDIVDPIGRGDAFAAGVIYGMLLARDLMIGLRYGLRLAALKQACRGDLLRVDRAELEAPESGELLR